MKETEADVLKALVTELEMANIEHKEARERESIAQQHVITATNRLNAAQKNLDKHMDGLRKAAPWNTEWSSRNVKAREA